MSKARRERRTRRRHRLRLARPNGTPRGQIKISAAIIRMMEPYDPEDLELDQYRILVRACTLAWNMAVVEQFADRSRPQVRDTLARTHAKAARSGIDSLLKELQERKVLLFPEDRRFIIETVVQPLGSGQRRLLAGSTPLDNVVGTANAPVENPPATTRRRGDGVTGPR